MNNILDNPDEHIGLSITKAELERREGEQYESGYAKGWHEGYEQGFKYMNERIKELESENLELGEEIEMLDSALNGGCSDAGC